MTSKAAPSRSKPAKATPAKSSPKPPAAKARPTPSVNPRSRPYRRKGPPEGLLPQPVRHGGPGLRDRQ